MCRSPHALSVSVHRFEEHGSAHGLWFSSSQVLVVFLIKGKSWYGPNKATKFKAYPQKPGFATKQVSVFPTGLQQSSISSFD